MGLNLSIKRIIFNSLYKPNNQGARSLIETNHLKQIAGRAGRLEESGGYVLATTTTSISIIKKCLQGINKLYEKPSEITHLALKLENSSKEKELTTGEEDKITDFPPLMLEGESEKLETQEEENLEFTENQKNIKKAILMPSFQHIEEFNNNIRILTGHDLPFSEIIRKLDSIAKIGGIYTIQNYEMFCLVADLIQVVKLSLYERYTFCMAPLSVRSTSVKVFLNPLARENTVKNIILTIYVKWVKEYSTYGEVQFGLHLSEIKKFVMHEDDINGLNILQDIYNRTPFLTSVCDVYLWLSFKFPKEFYQVKEAKALRENLIKELESILGKSEITNQVPKEITSDTISQSPKTKKSVKSSTNTSKKTVKPIN